jgi:lipopolysaccharide transport system ATP-binding protein
VAGIQVQSVSKCFRRHADSRSFTLQEAFARGFRKARVQDEFWALRDVSLEVAAGEMVGVIGRNGAGKSSLLRLVGGVGKPDSGRITVDGQVGALIDLGAGFHPELTGRENIYMNGVISGYSRRQVNAILDDIVQFAELEAFLDSPLRTYSTGMQLRLAFSVTVHVQPEVLLVDEVLAVGDLGFQQKCLDRIRQLQHRGVAILYVTHDLGQAEKFCDRIVWLNKGCVAAAGPPDEVVSAYREAMRRMTQQHTPQDRPDQFTAGGEVLSVNRNRFGSLEVELVNVHLLDRAGSPISILPADRSLTVQLDWRTSQISLPAIFGVGVYSVDGLLLCELISPVRSLTSTQGQLRLSIERLDLANGSYWVDVGVYPADWAYTYDYHWHVYQLVVETAGEGKGPLRPPNEWRL